MGIQKLNVKLILQMAQFQYRNIRTDVKVLQYSVSCERIKSDKGHNLNRFTKR